jgi:hypothetical protein
VGVAWGNRTSTPSPAPRQRQSKEHSVSIAWGNRKSTPSPAPRQRQSKEQFVAVERVRAVAWEGDELLFRLLGECPVVDTVLSEQGDPRHAPARWVDGWTKD